MSEGLLPERTITKSYIDRHVVLATMKFVTEQTLALLLLFALGIGASPPSGSLRADDNPRTNTIDTIWHSWSARQSRFTSVDYCYKTRAHGLRKGLLSPQQLAKFRPKPGEPEFLDYTMTTRLLIQAGSIRYELTGDMPDDKATLFKQDLLQTSNGVISKSFYNKGMHPFPTGFINKEPTNRALNTANARFPLWTFLPPEPINLGFDLSRLAMTGEGTVDGHRCLILQDKPSSDQTLSYWISSDQDCSIVRLVVETNGKVTYQMDCSYHADRIGLYVPMTWTATSFGFNNGEVSGSSKNEMVYCKFNVKTSAEDFDVSFLPGTVVSDSRPQPGIGRTGTLDYIVMPDGQKRIITWDKRFASYEELLATPSGNTTWFFGKAWFLVINLVLITAIVFLVWRRKMKRRGRVAK
jgi:hypothetical protein